MLCATVLICHARGSCLGGKNAPLSEEERNIGKNLLKLEITLVTTINISVGSTNKTPKLVACSAQLKPQTAKSSGYPEQEENLCIAVPPTARSSVSSSGAVNLLHGHANGDKMVLDNNHSPGHSLPK